VGGAGRADCGQVCRVRDEVGEFDDVVEACPGGGQAAAEVLEDLAGLGLGVALADELAVLVQRELAGDRDETARAHDDVAVLRGGEDPVGGGDPGQLTHASIVDHGSDNAPDGTSYSGRAQPRKPSSACSVAPPSDVDAALVLIAALVLSGLGSGFFGHAASLGPPLRGTVPSGRSV